MKTEKDIRKFLHENRIAVPKDDGFMDEVVRQINLLPVPASLSQNRDVEEKLELLKIIRATLRKRSRRQALFTLLVNTIICGCVFAGIWLCFSLNEGSTFVQSLYTWRYAVLGVISLCSLAYSFHQTRTYIP